MRIQKELMVIPAALAAMAVGSIPVRADNSGPNSYDYQKSTYTQQQVTSTPQDLNTSINDRNARAMALHDRAVALAHQATATAQRGDRRGAADLAAQAQSLYNQAFQMTHPQFYAHRRGMDQP
jgi:hypothetical protein